MLVAGHEDVVEVAIVGEPSDGIYIELDIYFAQFLLILHAEEL